jgi:hypothetical protein
MPVVYVAEIERMALRGVEVVRPNTNWSVPCDEACLPVWRRTKNGEGAGFMHWGGYHGDRVQPLFADDFDFSNHKWRLGVHCSNPACQNSRSLTLI